ncbi:hypothetical protein FNH05_10415, partial [Amycolatopsis rhizosphaerae]
MKVVGYAYPWDVAEPGFVERVRELGVDEVAVAVSYHSARAATPWSRERTAVLARHAALYRPVREGAWGRLRPGVPDWVESPDAAGEAIALLGEAGIPAAAWLVLTHDSRLGTEFPELTVRNCFGERYPWALCPSQGEVRAYAAALAAESLAGLEISSVVLEACGQLGVLHQCRHEKTDAVWAPAVARLLSVCCCDACAPGCETALREEIGRLMATGDLTLAEDRLAPEVRELVLSTRQASADALRRAVLEHVGSAVVLHGSADPWATGALPGLTPAAPEDVDTVVFPCWRPGSDSLDEITRARALLPSRVGVGAYVTAVAAAPVPDPGAYVAELGRA